ncbi:uncharacterized protein CEXT_184761 [Caerostris extrusa]|uniref:Uncharacterized protein n=1 Tax=Caerostris extrusa TaxID=172846 RepID=A0AAV4U369_CAEEX|nr:uncharacterized protein CEXT_184761 [Caerostris extrusa]
MFTLRQNPVAISLHREVAELRRATLQIAEDWEEMTNLMAAVKEQQNSFMHRLDSDFESMSDNLQNSVTESLEEESMRNGDRFAKIHG